jgi:cytochrome P450
VGLPLRPGDYFTFDVMSELVFSASYNLLDDAQNHFIIDGIVAQMQRFGFLLHFPGLEKIKMNHILFPHARRKAMRFYAKSKQIMEERKARGEEKSKNDVFSKLLTANDPETGESFSNQQLWVESNLLIIAGK